MKMKTKLTLLVALATTAIGFSQNTEACTENLSLMYTSAKAKDVTAYDYLIPLRKDCPSFNKLVYVYGEFAVKLKIDAAKDNAEKEKYVRDLMKLYDEFYTNFPDYGNEKRISFIQL